MLTLLPIILGALASILFIIANYVINRKIVITLQTAAILILIIQYGPVMGLWGVAAINMVFIIRNIFYSISNKQLYTNIISIVSVAVFVISYFIVQTGNMLELFLAFPLLAAILNTLAFMQTSTVGFKIVFGSSFLSWVAFDIIKQQWGNIIGDAFSVIAAIVSVILILKRNKEKSIQENQ